MILATLPIAALALMAAVPPLAGAPAQAEHQAANPIPWEALPALSGKRLRLGAGFGVMVHEQKGPGGTSWSTALTGVLDERPGELAVSLQWYGGAPAQRSDGRNTGFSGGFLRTVWRRPPFLTDSSIFFVEGGAQVGFDRALALCAGESCQFVPLHLSYGALVGAGVQSKGAVTWQLGLDLVLKGPWLPRAVATSLPLVVQVWIEIGFGGLPP